MTSRAGNWLTRTVTEIEYAVSSSSEFAKKFILFNPANASISGVILKETVEDSSASKLIDPGKVNDQSSVPVEVCEKVIVSSVLPLSNCLYHSRLYGN